MIQFLIEQIPRGKIQCNVLFVNLQAQRPNLDIEITLYINTTMLTTYGHQRVQINM